MENSEKCKVKRLTHIGILVEDVEKAVRFFEEELGIGPWQYDDLKLDAEKGDRIDGKPSDLYLKGARCSRPGPEIELIQPVSDGALKTWLFEHGPGLHHLGFETEEGFESVVRNIRNSSGKKSWFRGEVHDFAKFAYFDLSEEIGTFVEFMGNPAERFPDDI